MTDVADQIRAYIENEVIEQGLVEQLTNETQLWDEEIIDSMGMMMLIAHIEAEYEVDVEAEDVDVENFKSVSKIAALIERKQA